MEAGDISEVPEGDYPYAHTRAAVMLSAAIDGMKERGEGSLRQIAGRLGYKSAVVLSHLRTGRLPIPIDRVIDIARATKMEEGRFLLAVLEQRHPEVDFLSLLATETGASMQATRRNDAVEALIGKPAGDLNREQIGVIREIAADPSPRKRWCGVNEAQVLDFLREQLPDVTRNGLTVDDQHKLKSVLGRRAADVPDPTTTMF